MNESDTLLWNIYSGENEIRFLIELATPRTFTIECICFEPSLSISSHIPLLLISRIELTFNWIIAITLHSSRLYCARLSLSHTTLNVVVKPRIQREDDEGARDKTSLNTFYEIKTLIARNNFLTDTHAHAERCDTHRLGRNRNTQMVLFA